MKDKLGRHLDANDLIVYSTSSRDYNNFKFAKILEVEEKSLTLIPLVENWNKGFRIGKKCKISHSERILKIDDATSVLANMKLESLTQI